MNVLPHTPTDTQTQTQTQTQTHTFGGGFLGRIWGDNVHRHRRDLIHKQKRPTIQEKETYYTSNLKDTLHEPLMKAPSERLGERFRLGLAERLRLG